MRTEVQLVQITEQQLGSMQQKCYRCECHFKRACSHLYGRSKQSCVVSLLFCGRTMKKRTEELDEEFDVPV